MGESVFPITLLDLAGSIALLMWGVRMVQTGVQRAFGARLRTVLGTALRSPFRAFLTGLGVTAVLQSSTATGLMVSGFAAGGLVDLVPALAVMLGANVGTTLIVQLLAFDLSPVAPVLILIGVLMFRRGQASTVHDLGRVVIGLGLMLLALRQLLALVTPFEEAPGLRSMLGAIATQPWLDALLAAALTWAAHSSVAIVLLVMSLAGKGVVPPEAALALVLGANLGTAVNPLLESGGRGGAARRVPVGNFGTRAAGAALCLALLPLLARWLSAVVPDPARAVADFHLGFNLAVAALFFPVLSPYARLLHRLFPGGPGAVDPARPLYLDDSALEAPVAAIGAAAREALRLSDMLEAMLLDARDAFAADDRRQRAAVKRTGDMLERLDHAIETYLTRLDAEETSTRDQRRIEQILAFATNLKNAGDVVARNLMGQAAKRLKSGVTLSAGEREELGAAVARLVSNLRTAASVFLTADVRAARVLAGEKAAFGRLEAAETAAHFREIRTGRSHTVERSAWRLDLLRDLKRVNDHLVAAAAYPVLKGRGPTPQEEAREEEAREEEAHQDEADQGDADREAPTT